MPLPPAPTKRAARVAKEAFDVTARTSKRATAATPDTEDTQPTPLTSSPAPVLTPPPARSSKKAASTATASAATTAAAQSLAQQRAAVQQKAAATAPAPKATPAPAPAPVASSKVTYAADAFFDFDKSVLKPEGKAKLDDLVSKVKGINLEVIIAVGHTDSVGTDAYNQKLSVRRAEAVKAYLVSKGIEKNRVYTEGKGKKQPVADNKTKEGRAKNRRVEIEVVGTRAAK